jgi:hypothetical protein
MKDLNSRSHAGRTIARRRSILSRLVLTLGAGRPALMRQARRRQMGSLQPTEHYSSISQHIAFQPMFGRIFDRTPRRVLWANLG